MTIGASVLTLIIHMVCVEFSNNLHVFDIIQEPT